jgi:YHS domain-containing protein
VLTWRMLAFCAVLALNVAVAAADASSDDKVEAEKKELLKLGGIVGGWRGSGSIKASLGKDAWAEESEWGWDFKGGGAAVVFKTKGSRFISAGRITVGEKPGEYKLAATAADGKTQVDYYGSRNSDGELVVDAKTPNAAIPSRINLSLVAKGKRLVVQYIKPLSGTRFTVLAEVGLTLNGSGFGKFTDPHECIITGGTGSMTVSYEGTTYYVCCTGCKDAFNENPKKEIAAWKKRKAEEAKKQ